MSKTLKQLKEDIGFYLKDKTGFENTGEVISSFILYGMIIMCIAIMIDAFFIFIQRVFFG